VIFFEGVQRVSFNDHQIAASKMTLLPGLHNIFATDAAAEHNTLENCKEWMQFSRHVMACHGMSWH
jgi:hypothetical protein